MICPICNTEMGEEFLFCGKCGAPLLPSEEQTIPEEHPVEILPEEPMEEASDEVVEETPEEPAEEVPEEPIAEPEPSPPPVPKRNWVPYAIMALLFALGLGLFFATRGYNSMVTDPGQPWFSVYQGALFFDGTLYTGGSELQVPETIGGQTVTALSDYCFADCDQLTVVFLPDTVQTIGNCAFRDCDALRGIFLPGRVTHVGYEAFYNCTALESVCVPHTVTSIGMDAFDHCDKLLYIFYSGKAEQWRALYTDSIAPETCIIATDETIKQADVHN